VVVDGKAVGSTGNIVGLNVSAVEGIGVGEYVGCTDG